MWLFHDGEMQKGGQMHGNSASEWVVLGASINLRIWIQNLQRGKKIKKEICAGQERNSAFSRHEEGNPGKTPELAGPFQCKLFHNFMILFLQNGFKGQRERRGIL